MIEEKEKVVAVIVAAGSSTRMAGLDKQFALTAGRPLLAHSVAVFEASPLVDEYVVVLSEANLLRGRALAYEEGWRKLKKIVVGGKRRQDSVWAGLQSWLETPPNWVLVHDGARPFVTATIIEDGLAAAREHGASIAAMPVKDTIKQVDAAGLVVATPPRDELWAVQTPQIFNYNLLVTAHRRAITDNLEVTDDAMLVEMLGQPVKVFRASYTNLKVTTPEDLTIAQHLKGQVPSPLSLVPSQEQSLIPAVASQENSVLSPQSSVLNQSSIVNRQSSIESPRIGQGYDVHRLVAGRPLILGGVTVPFDKGLDGHSDADVLTHAVINALLGAASLGDIGRYFPPTDPVYKGISSLTMLSHINTLLQERGWQIGNIDATIIAQKPKLARHIPEMRQALAEVLVIEAEKINIKATTSEEMGFVGRQEGMAAQAVAIIYK